IQNAPRYTAAGFIILLDFLGLILGIPFYPEFMVYTYNTSIWPALLWVALVIFAPAFEETWFRGFLFAGFRQSRIGVYGTIGLTALLWALSHIQYGIYGITTIFVMGLLFGIARFKTDSLWSPLLMHGLINFVATLQVAINMNSIVS
ncbi:lysostaphin resistance A-like protein, partial [Chloroflexota bacterium]